jgi:hypothetical protein
MKGNALTYFGLTYRPFWQTCTKFQMFVQNKGLPYASHGFIAFMNTKKETK